jgi:hypothetical protein
LRRKLERAGVRRVVSLELGEIAPERGALRDFAKVDDARIAERSGPYEKSVGLAIQRKKIEPYSPRPSGRRETNVRIAARDGTGDFSMGGEKRGAGMDRCRIDALEPQGPVEARAHSGGGGPAGEPATVKLAHRRDAEPAPHREPDGTMHEMNEREPIPAESPRNALTVVARRENRSAPEQRQRRASVALKETQSALRRSALACGAASCSREEPLHRKVAVRGNERRRRDHWRDRNGLARVLALVSRFRRFAPARPPEHFFRKEPPLAADAMARQALTEQAVHVLRVDAQEPRDVSRGQDRAPSGQGMRWQRRARALHGAAHCANEF